MAEKKQQFKEAVKHIGFFHYRDVYAFCYGWLKDNNYDVSEDEYTERLTSRGKEIIIKWVAKKKVSDYFRNIMEVRWHILYMEEAEVMREGKKFKTNKGEVKITVTGILERDYEENWSKSPLYKWMRGIYDKYIIRSTMDQYEDKVIEESDEFVEQVKAFLTLEGKK